MPHARWVITCDPIRKFDTNLILKIKNLRMQVGQMLLTYAPIYIYIYNSQYSQLERIPDRVEYFPLFLLEFDEQGVCGKKKCPVSSKEMNGLFHGFSFSATYPDKHSTAKTSELYSKLCLKELCSISALDPTPGSSPLQVESESERPT